MKTMLIITREVQNNIDTVMNLAAEFPLIFKNPNEIEDDRLNFLEESGVSGLLVAYSLDVVGERCWFRHLSVSDHGETPSHQDVNTLTEAFGLTNCSACSTPMATHVFQKVCLH